MNSHIKGVLDAFASHLRLDRERFTLTDVARKYLALGTNVVPTQWVYDSVCSDYPLLALKTHNPPLREYADPRAAPLDPVTFVELIKAGFDGKKNASLMESAEELGRFVDVVIRGPKGRESQHSERWLEASRTDKWKDVALFLSLNYKEHTKLDALLKGITERNDVSDLRGRLLAYKPVNKQRLADEMAQCIKAVELGAEFVEGVESAASTGAFGLPAADSKTEAHPELGEELSERETRSAKVVVQPDPTRESISMPGLRPGMEAYRKRAGMGAIVETKRIAHQMLCAALLSSPIGDESKYTPPPGLLTRTQQRLAPLHGDEEHALVLEIIQSDALDDARLEDALPQSRKAQCVANACNRWTWEPRTLLAYMIDPKGHMDTRTFARFEKLIASTASKQDGERAFVQLLIQ